MQKHLLSWLDCCLKQPGARQLRCQCPTPKLPHGDTRTIALVCGHGADQRHAATSWACCNGSIEEARPAGRCGGAGSAGSSVWHLFKDVLQVDVNTICQVS
jgi:hypothetical protein